MLAHLTWRHMAGIDRRPAGCQQREEGGLGPLQMEGDLIVAFRAYFLQILIPRLTRIDAQLLCGLPGEQIPSANDVLGREWPAVVPSDIVAQRQGQLGALLVP